MKPAAVLAVFRLARAIHAGSRPARPPDSIPARFKLVAEEALVPAMESGSDESPMGGIAQSVFRNALGPLRFLRVVRAVWSKKPGGKSDLAAVAC